MSCYIPEKLKIVLRAPQTFTREVDGREIYRVDGRPAFATDAASPKTLETALDWAQQRQWDPQTREYIETAEPEVVEVPNDPFHRLQIVGLEQRGMGGRAYKVITEEGYLFDLREDVAFDIMLMTGILEGGVVEGDFVWGKYSSQMKILRMGSEDYQEFVRGTEKKKLKKIPNKDLVVGGVYRSTNNTSAVFRGRMRLFGTKKTKLAWSGIYDREPDLQKSYEDRKTAVWLSTNHSFKECIGHVDPGPLVLLNFKETRDAWVRADSFLDRNLWLMAKEDEQKIIESIRSLLGNEREVAAYVARIPRPASGLVLSYIREHEIPFEEVPTMLEPPRTPVHPGRHYGRGARW
jgi:hypothetical protein